MTFPCPITMASSLGPLKVSQYAPVPLPASAYIVSLKDILDPFVFPIMSSQVVPFISLKLSLCP